MPCQHTLRPLRRSQWSLNLTHRCWQLSLNSLKTNMHVKLLFWTTDEFYPSFSWSNYCYHYFLHSSISSRLYTVFQVWHLQNDLSTRTLLLYNVLGFIIHSYQTVPSDCLATTLLSYAAYVRKPSCRNKHKCGLIGGVTLGASDTKNGNVCGAFTEVMASTD